MKQNKFLILLFYYERPKIFLNALNSILENNYYENFEVHVIDDGSTQRAEPIVREVCHHIIDKFKFTYIEDTIENKKSRGGSIFGKYANEAMLLSDSDHVIPLCDDDALYPGFLFRLNDYLNIEENKDKKYIYHHLVIYDSLTETYKQGFERHNTNYYTNNWTQPINCNCRVDSSQVTFSNHAFKNSPNVRYPFPKTDNLDAFIFQKMFENWGYGHFSGLIGQIKSDNQDNLLHKVNNGLERYSTADVK